MEYKDKETYSPQILIVDDLKANLKLLTDILSSQGYNVRPAISGKLALRSVAVEVPDLILLDVKMPDMDGYKVCQLLKADEKSQRVPIIFISALDEVSDKVKGFSVGGVDYITKPFQSAEVLARVKTHLTIWHLQRQLEDQNLQLRQEITERQNAEKRSQELMQELEFTNQELKDFAHIVSHDLKAPLRGITSLAEWLANDYQDKLDEDGKEQLGMLLNRTKRMHNLLEGILRYSKLSYSKEEKNTINFNGVILEVVDMLVPPDNISIIIENEMPLLKLDRTRTQQLFGNLIGNAVKYMDKPNGQIRISCHKQGEFCQFSIHDNGCGIEARHFDKIFTIFQTVKSQDEFESTGIGLTIAKKIVEMYGGKIWVESKVGEGSTFHFTLPTLQNGV
ncbi:MAG: hybrid sensor histidine kinase/response regulator [Firmicutes bacterium HGW-Firmicutes-15]|nr:MAG: hybrid sensor histidine kinase/response regulator [Firmicutes bacterium HGW-Firmicutes-15]